MKFEKLNDNKIRITLTMQDLNEKHIDFHSFMSNTIESQDILLDMLEEAKKETGFDVENFNLKVETLVMADTNFIFTITKIKPDIEKDKFQKKRFTIKRKSLPSSSTQTIYQFRCFDDFCSFLQFLKDNELHNCVKEIANCVSLYYYKERYYLLLNNINSEMVLDQKFYTVITEFAKYVTSSNIFASKLKECGDLIMNDNALEIGLTHFV